jgi:hypothetical protein
MITSTRRELLQILAELSEFIPDVRLGQLVANLSYLARGPSNASVWDAEDEEMLEAARKHLDQWRARRNVSVPAATDIDLHPASQPQVPHRCATRVAKPRGA